MIHGQSSWLPIYPRRAGIRARLSAARRPETRLGMGLRGAGALRLSRITA